MRSLRGRPCPLPLCLGGPSVPRTSRAAVDPRRRVGRLDANIAPGILDRLRLAGHQLDELGLFHYVYAVLNAGEYRQRYAHGLRYDFARVPITREPELFDAASRLGSELAAIHLLEHPDIDLAAPAMDGDDRAVITNPCYDEAELMIRLAPDLVARSIRPLSGLISRARIRSRATTSKRGKADG
jgi:hypothetical protein